MIAGLKNDAGAEGNDRLKASPRAGGSSALANGGWPELLC